MGGAYFLGPFFRVVSGRVVRRAHFPIFLNGFRVVVKGFKVRGSFQGVRFQEFLFREGGRNSRFNLNGKACRVLGVREGTRRAASGGSGQARGFRRKGAHDLRYRWLMSFTRIARDGREDR